MFAIKYRCQKTLARKENNCNIPSPLQNLLTSSDSKIRSYDHWDLAKRVKGEKRKVRRDGEMKRMNCLLSLCQ